MRVYVFSGDYTALNGLSVRKELLLVLLLVGYCAYDLTTTVYRIWDFTTDDAYISWFYASQLVNGEGLVWHANNPPVEGYSNFLWIMMSALVIKTQLPLLPTIKWVSIVSLSMGLLFLYRFARLFFTPLLAILPVFIFSHYIGVAWWTMSGLETTFFWSLVILCIWQSAVAFGFKPYLNTLEKSVTPSCSTRAWVIANGVLFLLCLTRFEGLIWCIPLLFFMVCQLRQLGLHVVLQNSRKAWSWGLISFCCFIVPYGIYFIWRLHYFGHWIPNSYSCKALTSGQYFVVDLDYVDTIIPFIAVSLPYFLSQKDCKHILLWLPSVIYGLMLWKADPVIAHFLRLFLGPFALFTLLPVLGVSQFLLYFKQVKGSQNVLTALIIIAMTLLFTQGNTPQYVTHLVTHYQERTQNRLAIAHLLNRQASKGDSVLLGDCGVIPFYTRRDIHFIDSQCLNNLDLTHSPYRKNLALYADHLKNDVKPDWIITNYYPLEHHGDVLTHFLRQTDLFEHYELVSTLESGISRSDSPTNKERVIDYVYQIYKRRE